jgi:diguanylate cyclase
MGVDAVNVVLLGSALSFVLIDVSLALIALVVGFVSALWYVKINQDTGGGQDALGGREKEVQENDAERADMAAHQLRDLAHNMVIDVNEHSNQVEQINGKLVGLPSGEQQGNNSVVAEAIAQIVIANEKLQSKLEEAEGKISDQAEELRSQQSEARTDSLTQLANRRAFDGALAKGVEESQASKKPCTLLIFDVDHFKKFNDTHGHQAGDEVLRSVGKTIKQVVKSHDLPCRYGGEEFAVIMRDTRIADGRVGAERVRKAIEAMRIQFEGKALKVSASIGLAEIAFGEDSAKLIRRADEAVYTAKEAGRNCGYWHDNRQCLPMSQDGDLAEAPRSNQPGSANQTVVENSTPGQSTAAMSLSELPDLSVFSDELRRRIYESHRFGVSLSLIHLQVRGYQELESEYGTAVGGMLLDSVAQFIRSSLRDMDLLGKLEPGDFVVMLPGSSKSDAKLVGNRVQTSIANCAVPLGNEQLSLDINWGVATISPDDDSTQLLARAQQKMEMSQNTETVGSRV